MSKSTKIVTTYRYGPDELIQCSITIPSNYPDAIAEAAQTVLKLMREELCDVIKQNHPQQHTQP